jgi:hypothetical protein
VDEDQPGGFDAEVLTSTASLYGIEKELKGIHAEKRKSVRQARYSTT